MLILSLQGTAQQENSKSNYTMPNFNEIKKKFYENYNLNQVRNEEEEIKDGPFKKFKRWEWFWESRVDKDGNFPPADILAKELRSYKESHNLSTYRSTSTPPWTFKGPSTSVGGYFGIGRVNCIAFHPTDENIFWVGTPAGGIWKTTNGGSSWTTTTDDLPVLGITTIVVHPLNPNILFAATGDGELWYTKSVGILKSTDAGLTWSSTGLSWPIENGRQIRRLIMNPSTPEEMFAATSSGIFKTTDGWITHTNPITTGDFFDVEFKPGDPANVYASTYDYWGGNTGIFTSTDNGDTWNEVLSFPGTVCRINLAVSPASPNEVDAVCARRDRRDLHSIWRSTNSGVSYTQYLDGACSNNYLSHDYSLNSSSCYGQGDYDLAFTKNPANADEMWLGGVATWKTINGGSNWSLKNFWYSGTASPTVHADKHEIAYHPLNNKIYECNDGGLYVTSNGGSSWTNITNGMGITQIYKISTSATMVDNVICGAQDNSTKQLKNGSWLESLDSGDGIESIIDFTNPNIEYAMRINGELYKSTNGGNSWGNPIVSSNGSGVHEPGEWLTPLIMNPSNHNELLIGKSQVYRTTNGGANWSQLGTISGISYGKILSMAYAPSNTQIIYVASRKEVFKTIDGGNSWTQLNFNPSLDILSMAVSSSNPQKVWITQSHYSSADRVLHSADGGNTWTDYSNSLPAIPVNCIVYQNGSNDGLFIGTDLGVFYRDAGMSDWIPYNNGLPNVIVNDLEISYQNTKLWAGTFGRGLWSSGLSIGINEYEFSNSISVYPNPTDGIFTVASSLPAEKLDIEISNAIGEKLYQVKINNNNTEIDLSKVSNGIYFVKVNSQKGTTTKKIVLNKPD